MENEEKKREGEKEIGAKKERKEKRGERKHMEKIMR